MKIHKFKLFMACSFPSTTYITSSGRESSIYDRRWSYNGVTSSRRTNASNTNWRIDAFRRWIKKKSFLWKSGNWEAENRDSWVSTAIQVSFFIFKIIETKQPKLYLNGPKRLNCSLLFIMQSNPNFYISLHPHFFLYLFNCQWIISWKIHHWLQYDIETLYIHLWQCIEFS